MITVRTAALSAVTSLALALAALTPSHAVTACPNAPAVISSDPIGATLDTCGHQLAADAGPTGSPAVAVGGTGSDVTQVATGTDPVALSSRPGSPNTIYLDFTGETLTGTVWNSTLSEYPAVFVPFDIDKDPTTFSAAENTVIAETWKQVVADYAPFDVNVTTVDPGAAALTRGVRAIVTANTGHHVASCSSCTGWAFINTYPSPSRGTTPTDALIYANLLYDTPVYIAETISHEVGHTLGLHHDGVAGTEYLGNNDVWNPIMGAPTASPLTTWSNGDYVNATNKEDDMAIIGSQLGYIADDFPITPATATAGNPLPALASPTTGLISGPADTDSFTITAKAGTTIAVTPTVENGNLDVAATLTAADGTVVAESHPSTVWGYDSKGSPIWTFDSTGKPLVHFDANLTVTTTGTYTVTVAGSDNRDGAIAPYTVAQYSNYGIFGAYAITVTPPKVVNPTITTRSLVLTRGKATSIALKITGGKPAYYVSSSALPAGLHLSGRGVLTGKTTKTGTFKITVFVFDSNLAGGKATVALTVR